MLTTIHLLHSRDPLCNFLTFSLRLSSLFITQSAAVSPFPRLRHLELAPLATGVHSSHSLHLQVISGYSFTSTLPANGHPLLPLFHNIPLHAVLAISKLYDFFFSLFSFCIFIKQLVLAIWGIKLSTALEISFNTRSCSIFIGA